MRIERLTLVLGLCFVFSPTAVSALKGQTEASQLPSAAELAARDCFPACSEYSGSPYCLATGFDAELSPKLAALKSKFETGKVIPAAWLKATFNVPSDPCERTDTVYAAGTWRNTGLACDVQSQIDLTVGESVPVNLIVPRELTASQEQRGNYTLVRIQGEPMFIVFGDRNWHSDWGGALAYVAFDSRVAMFKTPRGCISVDLQKS